MPQLFGAVALMAAVSFSLYWELSVRGPPANLRVEGSDLIVMNHQGQELWRHEFPNPMSTSPYSFAESLRSKMWFGDLDRDGRVELLFVYRPVNDAEFGSPLYCFSETGKVKWQFTPGRPMRDRTQSFSGVYFAGQFLITKTRQVVIGSSHVRSYPFQIVVLDSQGGILSEYWHSGHLLHLRLADLDGDGTEEILAAGVSEAYRQATLVVLDLTGFFGASPAPPDSPEEFADMVPAVEKALVLFPKSCITRRFEPYNRVAALRVASDFIEAQVSQTHTDSGPNLLYQLNRRLEVVGLTVSEAFEKRHTELEAEGKLDHNLSAGEIAALKQVRVIRRR